MQGIIGLIALVLAIVALIDAIKSSLEQGKKILWIILIILIPFVGPILYFIIGKKKA